MPAGAGFVMRREAVACRRERCAAALAIPLVLCACAGVNTLNADGEPVRMSREAFAEYAEQTFRYHNRVVNDLITATSFGDEAVVEDMALLRAEERMAARCQPLNNMVTATIEGRELSYWAKIHLLESVPECADASRTVEARIREMF
ncbi:MAG: hypothetical protein ACU85U_09655 [Gammaproteobacteria bacterium]|jgi:hypothetical protein